MTTPTLALTAVPASLPRSRPAPDAGPRKLTGRRAAASVLGRAFHPAHLWRAVQLHRGRKANRRAQDDTRLVLYAKFLP